LARQLGGQGSPSPRSIGARGETIAAEHLRSLGYEIVDTNVRTRYGEIDIIAREGETLVFVEVKARRGIRYGSPQEALSPRKQARLRSLAEAYLQSLDAEPPACRIDVVAIALGRGGSVESIDLIRDAV
jgi:putative endonuclease